MKRQLSIFARKVIKQARRHLNSSPRRTKNKRINSSKLLYSSLGYRSTDEVLKFQMEDYGVDIDRGVMGKNRKILRYWNKSMFLPRGSGFTSKPPPYRAMARWVAQKPVQVPGITSAELAGMVRWTVYRNGIQPTLFFTDAFKQYEPELEELLQDGTIDIIDEKIDD